MATPKVGAYEAQHPHPQRLVMACQHRAGEVVEASRARLAPIPLPVSLGVVKAVPDNGAAAACGTAHPLRPAMLAHQGEALGIVDQRRKVDQSRCSHDARGSSCGPVGFPRSIPTITEALWLRYPVPGPSPRIPTRASYFSEPC